MVKTDFGDFASLLKWRAMESPGAIAYRFLGIDGESSLSYAQLDNQCRAIAVSILHASRSRYCRAMIVVPQGLDYVASYYACIYAGVVAVPVYTPRKNQKQNRLLSIIKNCKPEVILTVRDVLPLVEENLSDYAGGIKCVCVDEIDRSLAGTYSDLRVKPDEVAFLQYTSGSTGTPKGVMVTHANLMHNSHMIYQALEHNDDSCVVSWLPAFHDMGLIAGILQPVYGGFESVFMTPVSFLQQPIRWLRAISDYRATTSGGPNFAYDLCVESISDEELAELDLSSWRVAANGAEPVRASTLNRFNRKFSVCGFREQVFYPCYGMAEATLLVTGGRVDSISPVLCADRKHLQNNSVSEIDEKSDDAVEVVGCGKVFSDQQIKIVEPVSCVERPEGEVGEIWVSGPSVAAGYWNNPQASRETFEASIENTESAHFLRTGDLGFMRDGELYVTGRVKDLIIVRGQNYYPQDIELIAESSNPVFQPGGSAAFTIDKDSEEKLVIVLEIKREFIRKLDVHEVVNSVRAAVSDQCDLQVHSIALIKPSSLCRTSSGKVQRYACRQAYMSHDLKLIGDDASYVEESVLSGSVAEQKAFDVPVDLSSKPALEQWLKLKFSAELKLPAELIDAGEPLVRYGLDSVVAVRFAGEIEKIFQCKLDSTFVYDYPTIGSIAAYLFDLVSHGSAKSADSSVSETLSVDDIENMTPGEVSKMLESYLSQ